MPFCVQLLMPCFSGISPVGGSELLSAHQHLSQDQKTGSSSCSFFFSVLVLKGVLIKQIANSINNVPAQAQG